MWVWGPLVFPTAVTVGLLDVSSVSDGSVNIGVSFRTGGGGGSSVSNGVVSVQGEFAGAWVYSGQVFSSDGSGAELEPAPNQNRGPQEVSAQPGTFRFRFGGEGGGRHGVIRGAAWSRCAPE